MKWIKKILGILDIFDNIEERFTLIEIEINKQNEKIDNLDELRVNFKRNYTLGNARSSHISTTSENELEFSLAELLKRNPTYLKDNIKHMGLIPNYANIEQMKQIVKLSKKTIPELRKLNEYPRYAGKELTKYQLIYQIVFNTDYSEI